jgi:hypothetical protein
MISADMDDLRDRATCPIMSNDRRRSDLAG